MLSSHAPVPARPWRENKAEKSGGPMTAIAKLLERWHYAWHWTFAIHLVHLNPRWLGMDPSRSITDQDRPRYSQGVTEKGCKLASATPGGGHTTWKVLMAFTGSSLPDHWIMMDVFFFLWDVGEHHWAAQNRHKFSKKQRDTFLSWNLPWFYENISTFHPLLSHKFRPGRLFAKGTVRFPWARENFIRPAGKGSSEGPHQAWQKKLQDWMNVSKGQ